MYSVHLHPLINITSKTKQFVVELNILVPNHRWTMGNVSLRKPKLFCMYGKPTGGSGGQGGRSSLKGGLKLKSLVSHHSLIMNGLRSIIADLRLVRGLFNFWMKILLGSHGHLFFFTPNQSSQDQKIPLELVLISENRNKASLLRVHSSCRHVLASWRHRTYDVYVTFLLEGWEGGRWRDDKSHNVRTIWSQSR